MVRRVILFHLSLLICTSCTGNKVMELAESITWDSQSSISFTLKDGQRIHIDPYEVENPKPADHILITHPHFDHLSYSDLDKIIKPGSKLYFPSSMKAKLVKYGQEKIPLQPWESITNDGLRITAVPAYNDRNHEKRKKWIGYLLETDGIRIYHTGDTDWVPEMEKFRCDIILLPLGQVFTMSSLDAAKKTVESTEAKIVIPMHYGRFEGKEEDITSLSNMSGKEFTIIRKMGRGVK